VFPTDDFRSTRVSRPPSWKRELAICTKPLARQVMPLWPLDRVLDTQGGVHDTSTPTHAGRSSAAQLLRTHDPSLHPLVQGQQCTVLSVRCRIEQSADFFAAPDCGQLAAHLGLDDFLIEPGLLQRPRVEELQCRPRPLNGSQGKLPFVEQVEQKSANLFRAQLIG
jgi:hypothetical protein